MTKDEALKLALDLAIMHHTDDGYAELRSKVRQFAKEALAQPEQEQNPKTYAALYPQAEYVPVDQEPEPPLPVQPEERNFCPRCGKRTADLTVIHTCTPPRENT